jgi:hypothetical protein
MVKIISFSAVEILPALLNKTKTQTIRPLWEDLNLKKIFPKTSTDAYVLKKPRFKVGDKVKLMWKQRSKYKWFCKKCGGEINYPQHKEEFGAVYEKKSKNAYIYHKGFEKGECKFENVEVSFIPTFPKLLGTGTITEVFEIEMNKNYVSERDGVAIRVLKERKEDYDEFARRDGFKDLEELINWFDKHYDLSTSKRFAVYRWRWN